MINIPEKLVIHISISLVLRPLKIKSNLFTISIEVFNTLLPDQFLRLAIFFYYTFLLN